MRRGIVLGVVIALVAGGLLLATPAQASFHLIKITEIFPGTAQSPFAQYVELQMYAAGQTQTTGQHVIFYDGSGIVVADLTFTRNMPNGTNQSHILIASPDAEEVFGVTSDRTMGGDEIEMAGGRVCWGTEANLIDCASWGNFGTDGTGGGKSGTPFAASTGLSPDQSMTRKTSGGSNPSGLDEGDDTNDSATDFQSAAPSPQNNGTPPRPSASPSPTTTIAHHDRVLSLALSGKLDASGQVEVEDDFAACLAQAPVAVQKKNGRKWKTLKSVRTDAEGFYKAHIANAKGTYRAKAKAFAPSSTDDCVGVKSKQVHH